LMRDARASVPPLLASGTRLARQMHTSGAARVVRCRHSGEQT
jgi:hypothetical protein